MKHRAYLADYARSRVRLAAEVRRGLKREERSIALVFNDVRLAAEVRRGLKRGITGGGGTGKVFASLLK